MIAAVFKFFGLSVRGWDMLFIAMMTLLFASPLPVEKQVLRGSTLLAALGLFSFRLEMTLFGGSETEVCGARAIVSWRYRRWTMLPT